MSSHPLQHYHYEISDNNIGKTPAEPRDHARLFVYDTVNDQIHLDFVYNLANYLPENGLIILNNTGVIPARVFMTKDTGGKFEALFLVNEGVNLQGYFPIIVNKQIHVGRKVYVGNYEFEVMDQEENKFFLKPSFDINEMPSMLIKHGITPTPKYLGVLDMTEEKLRERYQTIYADENKSIAAPTASLHFTENVFRSLDTKSIERAEVTLHVGLGTFADINDRNIEERKLHTEPISISAETIYKIKTAKQNRRPIIGVGTTVVRSLESQSEKILSGEKSEIISQTDMFIMPGFEFKILDHLMTNFHVPKSSLMALVDAFLQHKKSKKSILELYQVALDSGFKFYSFGDSMLIL
jgi:S-adenosylmethionine:tRNA ribosyltransferase-isomerase